MTTALCILSFFAIFIGHVWFTTTDVFASHTNPWFVTVAEHTEPVTEASYGGMYGREIGEWRTSLEPVRIAAALEANPEKAAKDHDHHAHIQALITSLIVAGLGIFLAWFLYHFRRAIPAKVAAALGPVYVLVRRRYFMDELYGATVIRGTRQLAVLGRTFDKLVVDGLVNLVGNVNKLAGFFAAWFDRTFVDGAVNGVALLSQGFGATVRLLQTGRIQQYAAFAVAGGLLAAAWLILG